MADDLVKRPVTDRVAVASIKDKYSSYPSSGLTPDKLARIFKEADAGDIYRQMELFEEMEEKDPHLFSTLQTRKNGVLGLDWDVMPYSDSATDVQMADFIRQCFEFEGLEDAMLDLLDAIGKGFAVCENMYRIKDGHVYIDSLEWVHQKRFIFDENDNLRLITDSEPIYGIELPPGKFTVHKYKARSGYPSRAGVLRVAAWMYLFKNYTIKDWVTFAEVYGMPLRLGKYDTSSTEEDKNALLQAVAQLGSDAAGIISKSTEIEFVEAIKGSANVYETLVNFCNAEMSKAILGQTLTTEIGTSGSYAASNTHQQVRQDLLEADCKALSETLRRYIIKPLIQYNFGDTSRLPWIKFHYEPPEDLKAEADTYAVLVKDVGLKIPAEHIYEKFGIPKPEGSEAVVTPPGMMQIANKNTETAGISNQNNIDNLASAVVANSQELFERLAEPIMRLIRESSSLEEVRDKLASVYADMDTSELEDLIARALYVADLYGRLTIIG